MTEIEQAKRLLTDESCKTCIYAHSAIKPVAFYCLKFPLVGGEFETCPHYFNVERAPSDVIVNRKAFAIITQEDIDLLDKEVAKYR